MIIKIDKCFEKDTDKIKDKNIRSAIADCIDAVEKVSNPKSIKNIKKLNNLYPFVLQALFGILSC